MPTKEEKEAIIAEKVRLRQIRKSALKNKIRAKNLAARRVHIKAKFGKDTTKTTMGTSMFGTTLMCEDFADGVTNMNITVSSCPSGDYLVEWYVEVEDSTNKATGRLRHNKTKKKQGKAKKNGGPNNFFKGLEVITIVEEMMPQTFEIDLEEFSGGKAKMLEGTMMVYRKEEYVPPVRVINPEDIIFPIESIKRSKKL